MLYNALEKTGKKPLRASYNYRGENPDMVRMGTMENPLVFYLYGTIAEPESLVLTENNLIDFLVAVISKNPPLPRNILSELRNQNKSLLFLGFGFKHWYLRILLHVLQGHDKESRSFALEQYVSGNIEELQSEIVFFKTSDYKITICEEELQSFVRELQKRYEKWASAKPSEFELQNAPAVFLCHSGQNRNDVEVLRDRLREAGFNAWFDEHDQRGSDEWDRRIEQAIKKELDYVIVLQSQAMITATEGSLKKEIDLAFQRHRACKPGIRFIIPTKIEDCTSLEELEPLQTIDLVNKENVEKLISTLRRDQQRRKRK
jgi:hypothetical protein